MEPIVRDDGTLGMLQPLGKIDKSTGATRTRSVSPTSVIPLRDFSWASVRVSVPPPSSPGPWYAVAVNEMAKKERGELGSGRLMEPRGRALAHPAGPLLLEYARQGCPVDVGRPWSKLEIMTAAERGPHKSALA